MPNFQAKTKEEFQGRASDQPMPGDVIPDVGSELNSFTNLVDTLKMYAFRPERHCWTDILRDGYFDKLMAGDDRRYSEALILCSARVSAQSEEKKVGFLRVAQIRGTRGVASQAPTKVRLEEPMK